MKKLLPLLSLLLLFLPSSCESQSITITGANIRDANGNPYANGSVSAFLVTPSGSSPSIGGVPIRSLSTGPVPTNSVGSFSIVLNANSAILPTGTAYNITVCAMPTNIGPSTQPTPTQICFTVGPLTLNVSQDISTQLNTAPPPLLGPGSGGGGGGGNKYQSVQIDNIGLPQEPILNFIGPATGVDNPGNSSTDVNTCPPFLPAGASHASGCVPDPGPTISPDLPLCKSGSFSTSCQVNPAAGAAIKPDSSVAALWVAPTCAGAIACSDANDGLSWGTAKLTIFAALSALPGGTPGVTAGNGTVYIAPGSSANPTANAGIWLMGSGDPNFGAPPAGWLKCTNSPDTCILNIVGIPNFNGGPNSHTSRVSVVGGSNADRNHPGIWLSSVGRPFTAQNLQFSAGRGGVIGECSDHTRVNACGSVSETFLNDGFGVQQTSGNGPALDLTGYSYWIWFRDCGFSGNAYSAAGGYLSNNASGLLIDGSGNNGQGLIYVNDANFAGGGIKLIPGSLGVGSLYVTNAIEEGDFVHNIPPLVWFTGWGSAMDSILEELNVADPGPAGTATVQNDGLGIMGGPTVINSYGLVAGAAANISPHGTGVDPLVYGSYGLLNGYTFGNTNVARRIGGLTPTRFVNRADTNPANWTVPNLTGSLTLTTGVTDPFGGTGAATASTNSGTTSFLQMGSCTGYTPVAGDWIVMGEWEKNVQPTNDLFIALCYGNAFPTVTTTRTKGMVAGDGNWEYLWSAFKVISGGATAIGLGNQISNTFTPTIYAPVLYIIPAGTLSDSEVIEFTSSMNALDSTCTVGDICNVRGHSVSADSYKIRAGGFAATISMAGLAANRNIQMPDPLAPAISPLITGAIVNGNGLCASGTGGIYVNCVSGGGNVNNALQFSDPIYSAAGSANTISGNPPPTVNGFWYPGYNITAGVAVAKANFQVGLGGAGATGATTTYNVTYVDNATVIDHDFNCSQNINVVLPTPATLGNPNFTFAWTNHCPGHNDTITPTTWQIQLNNSAAGASVPVPSGTKVNVKVDPVNANTWLADTPTTTSNASSVNGASVPASASLTKTNASSQFLTATSHDVSAVLRCLDSSGSGTAQVCTTTPTFTPAAGDQMIYRTTTANTGALTINVNSSSAAPVQKWEGAALVLNDVKANTDIPMTYDGTNWQAENIGNKPLTLFAPITTTALNTSSIASTACDVVTVAVTGATTSDVPTAVYQGDVTALAGFIPSTNGTLYTYVYMTSGNINFKTCNNGSAASGTRGAVTAIWYIAR